MFLCGEYGHFLRRVHITQGELHCKTVHLRFGQRIRASELDRFLRGNDEEQSFEIALLSINADLAFTHCLEQGGLCARRGTVYFISQKNIREDWAFMKMEFLITLAEN